MMSSEWIETYSNPYDFINPIKEPEFFAGRQEELKDIRLIFQNSKVLKNPKFFHIAIIGPRAVGKTSLLNIIKYESKKLGLISVKIALNNDSVQNEIMFFKEVFDALLTTGADYGLYGGIQGQVYQSFRRVIDTLDISVQVPFLFGTSYIGLKNQQKVSDISQEILIHDFRELSKEAMKKNINTIIIMFDECDLLALNNVLLQKIRNIFSELDGYILIISGTENMFPAISKVFSPLPRFFKKIYIENFKNINETKECLFKPLEKHEQSLYPKRCIKELHQITNGNPYEINLIAHNMYRMHKENKTKYIELSSKVFAQVLNDIGQSRRENQLTLDIVKSNDDLLKMLLALLQLPNSTPSELSQFLLLDYFNELTDLNIQEKKDLIAKNLENFMNIHSIEDRNGRLRFTGEHYIHLYLKYYCASRRLLDIQDFFIGDSDHPVLNLHRKIVKMIMLNRYPRYTLYTKFINIKNLNDKVHNGLMADAKLEDDLATTIYHPKERDFTDMDEDSIRFRIFTSVFDDGFTFKVTFRDNLYKNDFANRLDIIERKLKLIGFETKRFDYDSINDRD